MVNVVAETISGSFVARWMLMGGTLAGIPACGWSCVSGCGGYIDTLLGPEGTRECLSLGNKTTGLDFSHTAVRCVCLAGWCWYGFGFVCCLRTAQWTRASL
jgi:hypothetical protein